MAIFMEASRNEISKARLLNLLILGVDFYQFLLILLFPSWRVWVWWVSIGVSEWDWMWMREGGWTRLEVYNWIWYTFSSSSSHLLTPTFTPTFTPTPHTLILTLHIHTHTLTCYTLTLSGNHLKFLKSLNKQMNDSFKFRMNLWWWSDVYKENEHCCL